MRLRIRAFAGCQWIYTVSKGSDETIHQNICWLPIYTVRKGSDETAGSFEHLLVTNGISMKNSCFNSFDFTGVLYAAFCNNENSAIQLSLGSFFPLLLLSGK